MIPLADVTRTNEYVPAVAPPLQVGQPHSEEHGSIEGELIACASHTHALFRDDNAADMMKPKQENNPMDAIVLSLLKVVISNTDAAKQAGEAAAVTNPTAETKRPPMTLKSIVKQA